MKGKHIFTVICLIVSMAIPSGSQVMAADTIVDFRNELTKII